VARAEGKIGVMRGGLLDRMTPTTEGTGDGAYCSPWRASVT
jgi:hypothetical protein